MKSADRSAVRWGVLSTARINDVVLESVKCSDRVIFAAIASRTKDRAEQAARRHGIATAYGNYTDLLKDESVEAVYISLPNAMHMEWSVHALEAGKHVLCEKPLSRRSSEVSQAFTVAAAKQRVFSEGFMYRHHPQTKRLIELVEKGAIGELTLILGSFRWPVEKSPNVRELQAELEGGALLYTGCYCVHSARLFGGKPHTVYAEQTLAPTGVDESLSGTIRFADGTVAQFDASLRLPYRQQLELVGTEGSLHLDAPWRIDWGGGTIKLRRPGQPHSPGLVEHIAAADGDSYRLEFENLSEAIRHGQEPLLGRLDAVEQSQTIEALFLSAAEHRPVALSDLAVTESQRDPTIRV